MAAELTPCDNNGRPLFGYCASVDPLNYYAPYPICAQPFIAEYRAACQCAETLIAQVAGANPVFRQGFTFVISCAPDQIVVIAASRSVMVSEP